MRSMQYALWAVLVMAMLMQACAPLPELSSPAAARQEAQAKALRAAGNLGAAARQYMRLARGSPSPQRERYALDAAELMYEAGAVTDAKAVLGYLDPDRLSASLLVRRQLLVARMALATKRPAEAERALGLLDRIRAMSPAEQIAVYQLRAQALEATGRREDSLRERIALDLLLTDEKAIRDNQSAMWDTLARVSSSRLRGLARRPPPDVFSGWVDLALAYRDGKQHPAQAAQALRTWRGRYAGHPASKYLLPSLLPGGAAPGGGYPATVALLLPLEGSLQPAAEAIRDGLQASYTQWRESSGQNVEVKVYNVSTPAQVERAYREAVADGAGFVIGPLTKEGVESLAESGVPLTVPVLALNRSNAGPAPPTGLFQFGLAPEDEAEQVAERAFADGHRRAVAIVPATDWGQRILSAFERRWQELGGRLSAPQAYAPETIPVAVARLLGGVEGNPDASSQSAAAGGHRDQGPAGSGIVFMAAFPEAARQINQLLRDSEHKEIPVYATSHVYSGRPDPTADRNLEGVLFCDIPLLVGDDPRDKEVRGATAQAGGGHYTRLFALGWDAFDLVPRLLRPSTLRGQSLSGHTGLLTVDSGSEVHRRLPWAQMRNGWFYPVR